MKLETYKNLYAYFITHRINRSSEITLQYDRKFNQYSVIVINNWVEVSNKNKYFSSSYDAKNYFRKLVDTVTE
jgi:hypothetical protein